MDLMTISQVSKSFSVSTRTLRYYEQIGLLSSQKQEGYAYRTYNKSAVRRLQQVLVLRKLRIPLKQIKLIFCNDDLTFLVEVFQKNIEELSSEITALNVVRSLMQTFVSRLSESIKLNVHFDLLSDENEETLKVVQALTLPKVNFKEERSMEELNKANENLAKLNDVRIIMLPPCTVASYHFIGENPEEAVGDVVDKFVRESNLYLIKPDANLYWFNHPNPSPNLPHHGYEDWVTIPDDMEVPAPLVKKKIAGGLYASHKIAFGDFHEWQWLEKWVNNSEKYDANYSIEGEEIMGGCLELHLNWVYCSHNSCWDDIPGQLDLLLPIKEKA